MSSTTSSSSSSWSIASERFFHELVGLGGVAQAEPRVLGELCARYELEMDPGSVPGLLERFGLRIGEPQA
jgi:hypothetical protein